MLENLNGPCIKLWNQKMKINDLLNEAPKKIKRSDDDSWLKKADDAVRGSFPMKAINQWALKLNTTPIYRDLLFVANMQVETFNLLNYLIKH